MKKIILVILLTGIALRSFAQVEPLWLQDSSFIKELYVMRSKFQSLSFTGYLQVQYQFADSAGISSYNGGNFSTYADNRFMIRRGRFRIDYDRTTGQGYHKYYFAMQFDGTEKGVNIRDMFGRIYENKLNCFVVTMGVFNRPFSYELNYSSSLRESPERGRMSQILMKTERDIGAMLSFEPQNKTNKLYPLKIDAGLFNGQGLAGTEEYDSFKDFISRISWRRTEIAKNLYLSGGVSYLSGGFRNNSKILYRINRTGSGGYVFNADTSSDNIGRKVPRIYYGADMQIVFDNTLGRTELRGELITGTQSATYSTSATPGTLPLTKTNVPDSVFVRKFNGAYFYLLHTFLKKHQVFLKYDWYDPDSKVAGRTLNVSRKFGPADIRYDTYGIGYVYYMNDNVKIVLYYDHPVNEMTSVSGYTKDLRDDTYTIRVQYRF